MYEIIISNEAVKYYRKSDRNTKRRINKCIDSLRIAPLFGPHIKKLHGEFEGKSRFESGGIRIIFEVNAGDGTVDIKAIGSRGDIYKS
jgi:mRNA interferase RelE/StbE